MKWMEYLYQREGKVQIADDLTLITFVCNASRRWTVYFARV